MSKKDTIYLVMGAEGDYEEYSTWPVAWFPTKKEAEAHARRLSNLANELREARDDWRGSEEYKTMEEAAGFSEGQVEEDYDEEAADALQAKEEAMMRPRKLRRLDPAASVLAEWYFVEVPRGPATAAPRVVVEVLRKGEP